MDSNDLWNGGDIGLINVVEMDTVQDSKNINSDAGDSGDLAWFIVNDDAEALSELLHLQDGERVEGIVDNDLDYDEIIQPVNDLCVSKPLSLAVIYGSLRCFRLLLDNGADIFLVDVCKNNLVHLLIMANLNDSLQLQFYDLILSKLTSSANRSNLLLQENQEGYHPLELSLYHRKDKLYIAILYTEGVYRTTVARRGKMILNKYDFTMYGESLRRFMNFPLSLLTLTENTELDREVSCKILRIPVMQKLLRSRLFATLLFTIIWFSTRCILIGLFISGDQIFGGFLYQGYCNYTRYHGTNLTFNEAVDKEVFSSSDQILISYHHLDWTISAIFGVSIALFDIAEFIWYFKKKRDWGLANLTPPLFKHYVVNSNFYRILMSVHAINILLYAFGLGLSAPRQRTQTPLLSAISPLIQRVLIPFTIMAFLQILPWIGEFIIGFQKMLTTLIRFGILQITIMYIFSTFFTHVVTLMCKPTRYTCGSETESESSFYVTFLIMLNMESVSSTECTSGGSIVLRAVHILYVFIVAIMTINYCIAVMNSVYTIMGNDMHYAVQLHRIHMAITIERRVRAFVEIFPSMSFCCRIGGRYEIQILETNTDNEQGLRNLSLPVNRRRWSLHRRVNTALSSVEF